jgi:hypothetical protein
MTLLVVVTIVEQFAQANYGGGEHWRRNAEQGRCTDRAGMTVFRDITFLAAGPASERSRSGADSCEASRMHASTTLTIITYADACQDKKGGQERGQRDFCSKTIITLSPLQLPRARIVGFSDYQVQWPAAGELGRSSKEVAVILEYHHRAVAEAKERDLLARHEVRTRLARMPKWLADLQTSDGLARLELGLGATVPAAVREFWQFPPLVCLLDAWQEDEYLRGVKGTA